MVVFQTFYIFTLAQTNTVAKSSAVEAVEDNITLLITVKDNCANLAVPTRSVRHSSGRAVNDLRKLFSVNHFAKEKPPELFEQAVNRLEMPPSLAS